MPSVAVSDETSKYLDRLRKKAPSGVPSKKEITEDIIAFVEEREDEFLEWRKKRVK